MLSNKSKALFVTATEYGLLCARCSSFRVPCELEALVEIPYVKDEEMGDMIQDFAGSKAGYLQTRAGVFPVGRFVRRFEMDPQARNRNANYFPELMKEQLRIDPDTNIAAIVTAQGGKDFDPKAGKEKELILAGAPREALLSEQQRLLDRGLFPQRMELGSLATIGGLIHYTQLRGIKAPTLILEITTEASQIFVIKDGMLDICRPFPFGINSMFPVIQKELGLKDENSARKLLESDTFDFTDISARLLAKIYKEVQASTGFYEVQTGQSIGQIFLPLLPRNLSWIGQALSSNLGIDQLTIDYHAWLDHLGISRGGNVQVDNLGPRWATLVALMADFSASLSNRE